MKKFLTIVIPIVTLVVGLVGGWFASAHFYNRWMESHMKTDQYNHLSQRCRVLVYLRAGKTNEALDILETLMDGDILDLAHLFEEREATSIGQQT